MYNLLPEETQKKISKEYRLRFLALLCAFFAAAFLIGAVLLLPSYLIVFQEKTDLEQELAILKKAEEGSAKNFSTSAKVVEEKIKALAILDKKLEEPHTLFQEIIERRGDSITIQHFLYEVSGTTSVVKIEGSAKTRDDLLAFQRELERPGSFRSAKFPVELLAKSRDVHFSMTVQ